MVIVMKRLICMFRRNDIVIRIYLSFIVVLAVTVALIGIIFMRLYETNYMRSYTKTLSRQCSVIAGRVGKLAQKDRKARFSRYSADIDELQRADEIDVWIVSNEKAANPLTPDYTNADTESLTDEMYDVLDKAFRGQTAHSSNFDKVYGMVILRIATPIYVHENDKEAAGAVMMVCMLDRQQMGVSQGKYLLTLSALLAMLISCIIALGASQYLSRPIARIRKDIQRLVDGDYSDRNTVRRDTQLGQLESALDELAGRLRQINEERENLDHVRQDFFANVSHELRTPITVMRGYSEALADGVVAGEEQEQEYYQRIVQECQGMERLVGDLFILSKMQNPDFKIEKEPISLIQIFSDVVRHGRILGKDKGIEFVVDMPENEPCLIMGDYDRLRQMFLIIVDNAVKFSEKNGRIEIFLMRKVQKESVQLFVQIKDHGIGIPEEQLPYIFEKFYTSKLRQNQNGTGLGLMIAKQIAKRHDGDISVESTPGEGTRFSFVFTECSVEDAEAQSM